MSPVLAPHAQRAVRFAQELHRFADAPALLSADGAISYAELAQLVDAAAQRHRSSRRLVLIATHNAIEPVVEYLAALATGSPVLLVPDSPHDHVEGWIDRYDPDVVVSASDGSGWSVDERRLVSRHDLHPDLALLLTTSGSTGSPKLVQLSHENLQINAEQIVDALGINATDRAILSLPLSYSYGLSVLHSHLSVGAAVAVTDLSVVDECFWSLVDRHHITTLPGVPYTFELLDRNGFAQRDVPSLKLLTQAGGRMDPSQVERLSALGVVKGFDLRVMYGQTEATARISVASGADLVANPSTVGRPLAGSHVRIDDEGQLIVAGPHVMLGYATSSDDFSVGRTVEFLSTGDIARLDDEGRIEITGRLGRFAKVFGLRIDLDRVEGALGAQGISAVAHAGDGVLGVLAVAPHRRRREVALLVEHATGLPRSALCIVMGEELPRTLAGKLDGQAVATLITAQRADDTAAASTADEEALADGVDSLCALFARRLGRVDVGPTDTFVTLGGDSLSYVEMSVVLERTLGDLPQQWHLTSIDELYATRCMHVAGRRRSVAAMGRIETSVVMRALAVLAVVGSHIPVFDHRGGAHLLLVIAGFSVARFQLTSASHPKRMRGLARAIARIAIPSVVWLSIVVAVSREYSLHSALLLNTILADPEWTPAWRYWFIETLVYLLIGVTLLMAIPAIDRLDRRWPFSLPMAVVAVGLLTRYEILGASSGPMHAFTPGFVVWLFALGWAAQRTVTNRHRLVVSAAVLLTVPGFSENTERVGLVLVGALLLVWLPTIRIPRPIIRPMALIAAASLWVYLSQWQVFVLFDQANPWLVFLAAVVAGIGLHLLWEHGVRKARQARALGLGAWVPRRRRQVAHSVA